MRGYYPFRVSSWPATDPIVTAVGGTQLHLDAQGNRTQPDNAWNDTNDPAVVGAPPVPTSTGGGLSKVFARPDYQNGLTGIVGASRGVPDISLSAACNGGVLIYIGIPGGPAPGYYSICGTSESTPLFAGMVAIADQVAGHSLGNLNPKLYALAARPMSGIVDVTGGSNTVSFVQDGRRHTVRGFTAVTGYDLATGLGTVDAAELVAALTQ